MNKVILLGAGPGDPGLLTIKGKEFIEKADCIIYDRLASKEILGYAKHQCEFIFVGKENHNHVMKQEDINKLLVNKSREYPLVVRLKGGDPYVFGRGGEEALYLKENGIEVQVVSGVTSAVSVLASSGIPVTHRGLSKGFQVITAHSRKNELADIDFSKLQDESITLVFLMGLSHVGEIARELMVYGRNKKTKIAVISKGTTPFQKKCIGTLEDIEQKVNMANLQSPSIIVVGEVVGLSSELDYFEKRPLFGKNVLVPYIEDYCFSLDGLSSNQKENALVKLLNEYGANVSAIKTGRIDVVDFDADIAQDTDWLIFTSKNGVYSFMSGIFKAGYDIRCLAGIKFAVIGNKTAGVLKTFGINADYISLNKNGDGFAVELKKIINPEDKVVYCCAERVDSELGKVLSECCDFRSIISYRNSECEIIDIDESFDFICFTSASSAERILKHIKSVDFTAVSIGFVTTNKLKKLGVNNIIQAEDASYESLVERMIKDQLI